MPKLDPDVHALRIDLDALRSQGPRFRYPPQLRLRVVSFARQRLRLGHSFWASAKLLSVAFTSLQKWLFEFPDECERRGRTGHVPPPAKDGPPQKGHGPTDQPHLPEVERELDVDEGDRTCKLTTSTCSTARWSGRRAR